MACDFVVNLKHRSRRRQIGESDVAVSLLAEIGQSQTEEVALVPHPEPGFAVKRSFGNRNDEFVDGQFRVSSFGSCAIRNRTTNTSVQH